MNAVWMVLLVKLPVWASRHQVTLRGASARIGIAFFLFGLRPTPILASILTLTFCTGCGCR